MVYRVSRIADDVERAIERSLAQSRRLQQPDQEGDIVGTRLELDIGAEEEIPGGLRTQRLNEAAQSTRSGDLANLASVHVDQVAILKGCCVAE